VVTISVLAGGPPAEHDVSLQSAADMLAELRRGGHDVRPVRLCRDGTWHVGTPGSDFEQLPEADGASRELALTALKDSGDVALLGLHGLFGEDGELQRLLEQAGIPFTGSGSQSSEVGMDKELSKIAAAKLGGRCASHEVVRAGAVPVNRLLKVVGLPCIVKPLRGGSSVGATRVRTEDELEPAVERARREDPDGCAMVEAWLEGPEVSCGVLRVHGALRTLPIVAIRPAGDRFYDYHAKYEAEDTQLECPATLPDDTAEEIRRLTAALYASLELRGVARMDFIVNGETGHATFLELNTLPCFTAPSLVPPAAQVDGLSRLEVLEAVLADARVDS
jgi:D-alanine-D-alanine ligase